MNPLVTVVALCYNHARFVNESVESVMRQTYSNLQLILVDDASKDDSQAVIRALAVKHPQIQIILLNQNVGNCRAFNLAWKEARGKYIIDFATDDVMMPDRIEKQVKMFESLGPEYGIVFTDSEYIDENGQSIANHYERLFKQRIIHEVPEGDVFRNVLTRYFISGPTMMVRSEVMQVLNGYDETLSFEDFDFWVRSSRVFQYKFLNERLTQVRKWRQSMSTGWYKSGDKQLHSVYLVCCKAKDLCRNEDDKKALVVRLAYEHRQALFSENKKEAKLFEDLLRNMNAWRLQQKWWKVLSTLPLPWAKIRMMYHKIYFGA